MRWLFHPLLLLLANSSEASLAKQVEYLKAENAMLRKRFPKWLQTTAEERALLIKLGEAVGPGIRVYPQLFSRANLSTISRICSEVLGRPAFLYLPEFCP